MLKPSNHPKLSQEEITYPTRLLETSEKTHLDDIGKANVSYGFSINISYEKKGIHLERHKVEYMSRDSNKKKDKHLIGTDITEKILSFLNKNNHDQMVLYHSGYLKKKTIATKTIRNIDKKASKLLTVSVHQSKKRKAHGTKHMSNS